jgi:hypothetical protein
MSLDFVVIPSNPIYEDNAQDVVAMMNHNIQHKMNIEFDTNYDKLLSTRIAKWRKEEYDIIIVDGNYVEASYLTVQFYEKGSRLEKMSLMEFIDTVSSFEEEGDGDEIKKPDDENNTKKRNDSTDDDDTNCVIM